MTEYVTYANYGNMPIWQQLMKEFPWLNENDARRIADEADRFDKELPETSRLLKHPSFYKAKYAYAEAKKLQPA